VSRWSILMLIVVALAAAFFIDGAYRAAQPPAFRFGQEYTLRNVQVLAFGVDEFHYQLRDERGTVFWVHFCRDLEPQFSPGMTLTVLTYRDMGECWSVKDTHPAYLIKRNPQGVIIKEDFHAERTEAAAH
jgi:hypothetical protein